MSVANSVVIVGAGHGGVQLAASLREEGYDGRIALIGDEPDLPYHRPPLSKSYVTDAEAELDLLRGPRFFESQSIELLSGETVAELACDARRVYLNSGRTLAYDHLVLATGSRNRLLPVPGAELDGVISLRTAAEGRELRQRLATAHSAMVIGGGFIGMEFAAAAAKFGVEVTVIEAAPRTMARAVSEQVSRYLEDNQRTCGVALALGVGVATIEGMSGRLTAVHTTDGERLPADLVVVGIGARPNSELAEAAGLRVGAGPTDGILVDERLVTSDPSVSAIGDCSRFATEGATMRLESVQNAVDQARFVASRLVGKAPAAYDRVPWFWSDQGSVKLQIAGMCADAERLIVRGDPAGGRFSLIGLTGDRVVAVESVNKPADHMAARKLVAARAYLSDNEAADVDFSLKTALSRAKPAA